MESLAGQFYSFAATILIGAVAGFCYDYYRVVRQTYRLRKAGSVLGDVSFCLIASALVFLMLLWGNSGEIRLYVFIGFGLGAFAYFHLFSNTINRLVRFKFFLFHRVWDILVKSALFLWSIVLFPFRLVTLALSYPVNFLKGLLGKARQKLKNVFYNIAGKRIQQCARQIKSRLSTLTFWKKKK